MAPCGRYFWQFPYTEGVMSAAILSDVLPLHVLASWGAGGRAVLARLHTHHSSCATGHPLGEAQLSLGFARELTNSMPHSLWRSISVFPAFPNKCHFKQLLIVLRNSICIFCHSNYIVINFWYNGELMLQWGPWNFFALCEAALFWLWVLTYEKNITISASRVLALLNYLVQHWNLKKIIITGNFIVRNNMPLSLT